MDSTAFLQTQYQDTLQISQHSYVFENRNVWNLCSNVSLPTGPRGAIIKVQVSNVSKPLFNQAVHLLMAPEDPLPNSTQELLDLGILFTVLGHEDLCSRIGVQLTQ